MRKPIKIIFISLVTIVVILFTATIIMGISPISFGMHDNFNNENGVAAKGYDVVAYFKENKAIKGADEYTTEWNNVTWKFSSNENLEAFKATPEKYKPCYGGYCAFAIGKGFIAPSDPNFWSINDERLFFYSNEDVKNDALKDIENVITSGDKNWK